jgi:glycosyltransferase involved in cell wall biosynthesis
LNTRTNSIAILGIRGVPAAHGGFETFAERFVIHLKESGWDVLVYCQEEGTGAVWEDTWEGIRRIHIPISGDGPRSTVAFDWKSVALAARDKSRMVLTLGYNTAAFCARLRLAGIPNVINMDGIEWHRQKWGVVAKTWFWLNDWAGCWLGNHLVADHPEIKRHLETRVKGEKITMIPYGADSVISAESSLLKPYGLAPGNYAILIARAEPENSILEVVSAWSRKARGVQLVVLGKYESSHAYQRAVQEAASSEVVFPGAIYDKAVVQALRFHARLYIHGHQVGGTNPSLVEALGAGNAVLAHDNRFNRWVAGPEAHYFANEGECATALDDLLADPEAIHTMSEASRRRHEADFTWPKVLREYEVLMERFIAQAGKSSS